VGISGYLTKQTVANDLIKAVRDAFRGKLTRPSTPNRFPGHDRKPNFNFRKPQESTGKITSREGEVLQLVAEGYQNKEMANLMGISIKTVEKHRQHLMDSLKIHDTAGLTRYAIAHGFVENKERIGKSVAAPSASPSAGLAWAGLPETNEPGAKAEAALPSISMPKS
jgi:DNA-binding NarL/FixJ family response regulator